MRVGTAPISWGVSEMADWGEVLPPGQVLDEMADAGYAGTELGPWGYLPDDVHALRVQLERRNLVLIGGFCPVTLHQPERLSEQRQFATDVARRLRDLGAGMLVLAEAGDAARLAQAGQVTPGATPAFDAEEWQRVASAAEDIAAEAQTIGLQTAFHPHVGSYVETEAETERLLALTDPTVMGLCIDTGHLTYAGADPVTLTERHRDRVRHVHLKDVSSAVLAQARRTHWSFAQAVGQGIFVPLGEGMTNVTAMLAALRGASYAGWLVVEQDRRLMAPGAGALPLAEAKRSRATLRALGL